jgi:hypothetical protein
VRLLHQRCCGRGGFRQGPQHAELGQQHDQLLLDAVVEIALEAATYVVLGTHEPLAGRGELAHTTGQHPGQLRAPQGQRHVAADQTDERDVVVGPAAAAGSACQGTDGRVAGDQRNSHLGPSCAGASCAHRHAARTVDRHPCHLQA